MSECMLFQIIRGGKRICDICYKWSAYTWVVYSEAKVLLDGLAKRGYRKDMTDGETVKMLCKILVEDNAETLEFPTRHGKYEKRYFHGGADNFSIDDISKILGYRDGDDVDCYEFQGDPRTLSASYGILTANRRQMDDAEDFYAIEKFDLDNCFVTNGFFWHHNCLPPWAEELGDRLCIGEMVVPEFDFECVPFEYIDEAVKWFKQNFYDSPAHLFKSKDEYIEVSK